VPESGLKPVELGFDATRMDVARQCGERVHARDALILIQTPSLQAAFNFDLPTAWDMPTVWLPPGTPRHRARP